VTEGALVGQGEATQLAVVQQIDPLYVNFTQSAGEVLQLRRALESGPAQARAGAPTGRQRARGAGRRQRIRPQAASLLFTDLTVDATTGQVTPARRGAQPKGGTLLPGLYVRVRLEQARRQRHHAAAAGRDALGPGRQRSWWWAPRARWNSAHRDQGRRPAGRASWVVLDGLKAGEQVMVDGFQKLQMLPPGTPVKPVPWQAPGKAQQAQQAFFIDRPIFAWVIALFIMVMGAVWPSRSCRLRSTRRWRRPRS
jgi:membrane fusion protein (multidrug efflux system)